MGCHFHLQAIFQTQGSPASLVAPALQADSLPLRHWLPFKCTTSSKFLCCDLLRVGSGLPEGFSQCSCSTLSFRSSLCICTSVHTLPQPCCWMLAHLVVGSRGVLCCLGSASALGRPCCHESGEWIFLGEPATSYGLDQNFLPLPQPKRVVLFFFHSVSAVLGVTEFAHFPGV